MSVFTAQINLAFEDRYLPKSATVRFESILALSLKLVELARPLIESSQVDCQSVYSVFHKKVQQMNRLSDLLAQKLDLNFSKIKFWEQIFSKLIEESLPYSRDGIFLLSAMNFEFKGRIFFAPAKQGTKDLWAEYSKLEQKCREQAIKREYSKRHEACKKALQEYFEKVADSIEKDKEAINTFRLS